MSPAISAHHTSSLLRLLFARGLSRRSRTCRRGPGSLWSYQRWVANGRRVESDALRLEQRAAALRFDALRLRHNRAVQKTQTRQLVESAQAVTKRGGAISSSVKLSTRTRELWNGLQLLGWSRGGASGPIVLIVARVVFISFTIGLRVGQHRKWRWAERIAEKTQECEIGRKAG